MSHKTLHFTILAALVMGLNLASANVAPAPGPEPPAEVTLASAAETLAPALTAFLPAANPSHLAENGTLIIVNAAPAPAPVDEPEPSPVVPVAPPAVFVVSMAVTPSSLADVDLAGRSAAAWS